MKEEPIVIDTVILEIKVTGNVKDWTNQDVELVVEANKELSSLKMGETEFDLTNPKVVITENGTYEFVAVDTNGNSATARVEVSKIDKVAPVVSNIEATGRNVTITAADELSGVSGYSISTTTEQPGEWSNESVIKTTEDGTFYVWVKDNAGNISIIRIRIMIP